MIWKVLSKIFGKKEEAITYPPEYGIIVYNQAALRNGLEDTPNKLIIRYRYNYRTDKIDIYRVYGYSDSLLHNLKEKLKIPIYDGTKKEIKFPVYEEINLSEVSYLKG